MLSSLHTVDAAAALTRLTDMGIAPYLVTASLTLVASQRLVRTPCPECVTSDPSAAAAVSDLGYDPVGAWVRAVGCPSCHDTGYRGRTAVVELLQVDAAVRQALLDHATDDHMRSIALASGFQPMFDVAVALAALGRTTVSEVHRAVPKTGTARPDPTAGTAPHSGESPVSAVETVR